MSPAIELLLAILGFALSGYVVGYELGRLDEKTRQNKEKLKELLKEAAVRRVDDDVINAIARKHTGIE